MTTNAQPTKDELTTLLDAVVNAAVDCGLWNDDEARTYSTLLSLSQEAQAALQQYVQRITAERDQYKQKLTEAQQLAIRQGKIISKLKAKVPARDY